MSVTTDKKIDVLKWQSAIKVAKLAKRWEAAANMWGLDNAITKHDFEELEAAISILKSLH